MSADGQERATSVQGCKQSLPSDCSLGALQGRVQLRARLCHQCVHGTAHSPTADLEYMRVDHGGGGSECAPAADP